MQQAVIAAAVDPVTTPVRRRPSLCHDGTAVVYSQDAAAPAHQPGFRVLTEPGGVARTVPEQIDFSLALVDRLLVALDWRDAVPDLNAIATALLPRDAHELGGWWGGVWLGVCQTADHLDLRLYLNLRHGPLLARWQRLAAMLGGFGDDRLEAPLQALADRTMAHAIPVGLGVVVRDGRVPVLRLYLGAHRPRGATLAAMLPPTDRAGGEMAAALSERLGGRRGLPSQSVTCGYDFLRDASGVIRPEIARVKIDVSCQWLPAPARAAFLGRAISFAHEVGVDTAACDGFLRDLRECFGGFSPEYVSFTLGHPTRAMTLYAKPAAGPTAGG